MPFIFVSKPLIEFARNFQNVWFRLLTRTSRCVARVAGKRLNRLDTDTDSSPSDNERLIITKDLAHHPPYRHLDDSDVISDVINGASKAAVTYLLPLLGLLTVFLTTAEVI